jgi:hypothetical protein
MKFWNDSNHGSDGFIKPQTYELHTEYEYLLEARVVVL